MIARPSPTQRPPRLPPRAAPPATGSDRHRLPANLLLRTVLLLLLAAVGPSTPHAAGAQAIDLFNGRTLEGWHSWLVDTRHDDPRGVFTVTNGLLRISGDGLGYLATEREFGDFRLDVEWRWGTRNTAWGDRIGRARDSGLFLHATGPDGNSHDGHGAFMAAIECNLFQGATGDLLLIRGSAADGTLIAPQLTAEVRPERDAEGWFTWKPGGPTASLQRWGRLNNATKSPRWTDRLDFRGPHDAERQPGRWNRTRCEWRHGRLRIHVNGILVNEATDPSPTRGRILLQCEGSEILFRRVRIHPFPDPDPSPDPNLPGTPH